MTAGYQSHCSQIPDVTLWLLGAAYHSLCCAVEHDSGAMHGNTGSATYALHMYDVQRMRNTGSAIMGPVLF